MEIPKVGSLCPGEAEPELHFTGIWATPDQRRTILEAIQTAERFIDLAKQASVGDADAHKEARRRVLEIVHQAALENGLPDFDGFYGIDQNGQFVRGAA